MDHREYKKNRINDQSTLSNKTYNLMIGLTLIWGLVLDVFICIFASDYMVNLLGQNPTNYFILLVVYIIVSIGAILLIHGSDSPIISFIGFTILSAMMGILVCTYIQSYSSTAVLNAIVCTTVITAVMTVAASVFPSVFERMGRALLFALIVMIVVDIISLFFFSNGYTTIDLIIDIVFVAIFSLFIAYDYVVSQKYGRTLNNAIDSAADIYIDVINLFVRLLSIFGNSRN